MCFIRLQMVRIMHGKWKISGTSIADIIVINVNVERFHFEGRWDNRFSLTQIPSCEHTKATWQKFKPIRFHFAHRRIEFKEFVFSLLSKIEWNSIWNECLTEPNRTGNIDFDFENLIYCVCVSVLVHSRASTRLFAHNFNSNSQLFLSTLFFGKR